MNDAAVSHEFWQLHLTAVPAKGRRQHEGPDMPRSPVKYRPWELGKDGMIFLDGLGRAW